MKPFRITCQWWCRDWHRINIAFVCHRDWMHRANARVWTILYKDQSTSVRSAYRVLLAALVREEKTDTWRDTLGSWDASDAHKPLDCLPPHHHDDQMMIRIRLGTGLCLIRPLRLISVWGLKPEIGGCSWKRYLRDINHYKLRTWYNIIFVFQ